MSRPSAYHLGWSAAKADIERWAEALQNIHGAIRGLREDERDEWDRDYTRGYVAFMVKAGIQVEREGEQS